MRKTTPMRTSPDGYGPFGTTDPYAAPSTEERISGIVQNMVSNLFRQTDFRNGETLLAGEADANLTRQGVSCEIMFLEDPLNGSAKLLIKKNGVQKYTIKGQKTKGDDGRYNGKYKVFAHRSNADIDGTELDLSSPDSADAIAGLLECLRALRFTK